MTNEEKQRIYKALSAPFTDEAIERTEGRVTGRGYDTTGIKYQYVVNRLNEVLGVGSWRTQQTVSVRTSTNAKGRTVFEAACDVTLQFGEWSNGAFLPWAEAFATGGHQSVNEADARKGGFTNSLKKAAAMMGCGKQAYEGTLDDDNVMDEAAVTTASPKLNDRQTAPRPVRTAGPTQQATPEPPPETRTVYDEPAPSSQRPQSSSSDSRNRLSAKQLAALWALARKLNYSQQDFRQQVKKQYGVQPEFLDKNTASTIIGQLSARASNGASHPAGAYSPSA